MKELTHEDWEKNPTPRMMWVWDGNERDKVIRKVIYFLENKKASFPVVALADDGIIADNYKHCAEIEEPKTRRMTKQELSWWLRDGKHREWSYERAHAYSCFDYYVNDADVPVEDTIFIREDGGEWKEPLVEV